MPAARPRAKSDEEEEAKAKDENEEEAKQQQQQEEEEEDGNAEDLFDSVIRIYCTHSEPNYHSPWQRLPQYSSTSSGFVVCLGKRRPRALLARALLARALLARAFALLC